MQALFDKKNNIIFALLVLISIFFLFSNLDDRYLWLDEAETAVMAQSVLEHGVPQAYGGKNPVSIHIENSYRGDNIWTFHPWLQFYITAASFAVLGPSTFSARLPFAMLGFLSILLTYILALRIFKNKEIALLSMAFLIFSVPFILHMRECRYYAPSVFFPLSFIIFYLNFFEDKKMSFIGMFVSANLLFHSNYGIFIPVQIALILHFFYFHRNELKIKSFLIFLSLVFISTFPWFIYLRGFQHGGALSWDDIRHHMQFYFKITHKFIFPVFFFVVLFGVYFFKNKIGSLLFHWKRISKSNRGLFYWVIFVSFLFVCIGQQHFYRYVIYLVPLFVILKAALLYGWLQQSFKTACICIVILVSTNLFYNTLPLGVIKSLPQSLQKSIVGDNAKLKRKLEAVYFSPVANLVYELTHHYKDSNRGIVNFLNKHAKAGDSVGVPYSLWPMIFYTDFKVDSLWYDKGVMSDWIVFQKDWFETIYGNYLQSPYYQKILKNYETFEIDYADRRWTHTADPYEHRFKTDEKSPRLVIFRKKKGDSAR